MSCCPDPDPTQYARRAQLVEEIRQIDEENKRREERERYSRAGSVRQEDACRIAWEAIRAQMDTAHSRVPPLMLPALRRLYQAAYEDGQVTEFAKNSLIPEHTGAADRNLEQINRERFGTRKDGTTVVPGRGIVYGAQPPHTRQDY